MRCRFALCHFAFFALLAMLTLAALPPARASVPAAPTSLTATTVSPAQINLTWTAPTGTVTSYNVKRGTATGGPYTTVGSPTTTSYASTGLSSGTRYYFVITAVNAGGESVPSAEISRATQCAAPTGLTATSTATQIGLTWATTKGATSYSLYGGTSAGGESGTAYQSGLTGTSYTDTAVTVGTAYYYTLKALNSGGTSAASAEASATPGVVSLSSVSVSPSTVTGGTSATGTVTLSGAAPAGGVTVTLSDNSTSVTVPASVTVLAGSSTATFTVTTTSVTASASATITATYSGVSKTATLTVTPAVTVPLYLSNLTVNPSTVTGGNGTTGTVTLSSPAPVGGVTVTLHSDNSAAVVPANVVIAGGATSKTFSITTNSVSASTNVTLSGSYNGWTQGDGVEILPTSLSAGLSFDIPRVDVAPGNGCAIIAWNPLADGTVNGYNVYRTSGGTRTRLTATPFESNFYPDTGLTNGTTYTYQVSAVDILGQEHALSTPVGATPSSATETLNWVNPPSAVTDRLIMDVALPSGAQVFGPHYFIDGAQVGGGGSNSSYVNGVQTHVAGAGFDSSELTNGPHTVQFIGFVDVNHTVACVTPPITIQVNNTISDYSVDNDWLAPGQELCFVSATVPAGSTWTVQVTSADGATVLRTWQGASSLVKLAWDGKDASGNVLPVADYALLLTVQPPAPKTGMPVGTKSAQPVPNATGTATKKHPTKVVPGQPSALALISVGASYTKDSNGHPVPLPAVDINLANVLTNAYTTLYGANNFEVIQSDTFVPDHVVKKSKFYELTSLQQLKNWLGAAQTQVFYFFGHGATLDGPPGDSGFPRSVIFGGIDKNQGAQITLYPATPRYLTFDNEIIVPKYVGSHPYVFAWMDACNTAGGNSTTGERGTEDDIWATAFNATTFIGNNGFVIVNNNGSTGPSKWYKWRNTFWTNLALGQTITQAYLTCWVKDGNLPYGYVNTGTYPDYYVLPPRYDCTPGDGYGIKPRVVLYGEPDSTTLVPQ